MAVTYFGVDLGAGSHGADVTVAASTTSSDVELAVDDTNLTAGGVSTKGDVLELLELIRLKVLEQDF